MNIYEDRLDYVEYDQFVLLGEIRRCIICAFEIRILLGETCHN